MLYIEHMTSTVTVDQTTTQTTKTKPAAKSAAVNALATVGFIALLILGITLAIYSARYVPMAVSKLAGFSNNTNNSGSLAVVTSSSTIPFDGSGSDSGMVLTSSTTTAIPQPASPYTSPNPNTAAVAPATVAPTYHAPGLPDLAVTILATGYLTTASTDSFVPASIIPPGARPAVRFSIANDGTAATGPWTFLAHIPSINNFTFNSPTEPSLNPGDHTVFTLGFNEAIPGQAQTISVIADPNDYIVESNETNNSAAAAVTITQTGN
jgi:hypothetical protein